MTVHSSRLPTGLAPLIAEAKDRMRRRRSLVALLVVFAGLAVGLTLAFRPSAPGLGAPRPLTSSVRAGDLRVSVPRGFHTYEIRNGGYMAGTRTRPPVTGHVLTDFRLPAHLGIQQALGRWAFPGWGPPAHGVWLELARWFPFGPAVPGITDRLHLPLSLNQPWAKEKLSSGRAGYRWGYLIFPHAEYQVMYWSGPKAPAADRAAILRALESIRPARLK
jgi:hypothetical protein